MVSYPTITQGVCAGIWGFPYWGISRCMPLLGILIKLIAGKFAVTPNTVFMGFIHPVENGPVPHILVKYFRKHSKVCSNP